MLLVPVLRTAGGAGILCLWQKKKGQDLGKMPLGDPQEKNKGSHCPGTERGCILGV